MAIQVHLTLDQLRLAVFVDARQPVRVRILPGRHEDPLPENHDVGLEDIASVRRVDPSHLLPDVVELPEDVDLLVLSRVSLRADGQEIAAGVQGQVVVVAAELFEAPPVPRLDLLNDPTASAGAEPAVVVH